MTDLSQVSFADLKKELKRRHYNVIPTNDAINQKWAYIEAEVTDKVVLSAHDYHKTYIYTVDIINRGKLQPDELSKARGFKCRVSTTDIKNKKDAPRIGDIVTLKSRLSRQSAHFTLCKAVIYAVKERKFKPQKQKQ